jgi:hypothetical protein
LFEAERRARLTHAKERFLAIYRAARTEAAANVVGERAAAERAIIAAQEAAAHARSDQVAVRAELASMTERALKAEMAIQQGRDRTTKTRSTASRKAF